MTDPEDEILVLLTIDNMILAQDIRRYLEDRGVHTLVESDNPASSVMNIYTGMNAIEGISIKTLASEFETACNILEKSPYSGYVSDHPRTDREP